MTRSARWLTIGIGMMVVASAPRLPAQSAAPAIYMSDADLMATLTVGGSEDGASFLRVDLNNSSGVERVRIRLSRPELGEDLLDTHATGDGGWVLDGNEVAVPGAWHAIVVVRRTNIFDDAQAAFARCSSPGMVPARRISSMTTGHPSRTDG